MFSKPGCSERIFLFLGTALITESKKQIDSKMIGSKTELITTRNYTQLYFPLTNRM